MKDFTFNVPQDIIFGKGSLKRLPELLEKSGSKKMLLISGPVLKKIGMVEKVEENEYFHDRRIMVSIFMSLTNVHANWFPVEGFVKLVEHQNGNFHKAWLPKASMENERTTVVIETPAGEEVLVRPEGAFPPDCGPDCTPHHLLHESR